MIRNFEIIGEAANRLPEDFKDAHENVNWFRIRGFRNRIVHDYMELTFKLYGQLLPKTLTNLQLTYFKLLKNHEPPAQKQA